MMSEYKCISCFETRQSEQPCFCPVCGYKMYRTPYVRADILASEIESFASRLDVTTVMREDLIFEGKDEDDHHVAFAKQVGEHDGERQGGDHQHHVHQPHDQVRLHHGL